MLFKFQYSDEADRQVKLNANLDKYLIEEQNITDGNFLIFSDTPTLEIKVIQQEEKQGALEERVSLSEDAINFLLGL
jgi:hypothetical protein